MPFIGIAAREDRLAALLARARPDDIAGLALKVRAAFYGEDIRDNLDCDTRIMAPALRELERMAGSATIQTGYS